MRTMVLTAVVQGAAIAALPILLATGGAAAMPAVFALFMLNGAAGELFDVGRRAALPQIVGRDEGALKVFNGKLYVWREIAATAGVFGAGWFVHAIGATSAIYMHPAFAVVAAFALWRIFGAGRRAAASPTRAATLPTAEKLGPIGSIKAWLHDFLAGAKRVIKDPHLRLIVGINIPLNVVHKIFHTLIAVVFATHVLHTPAMAAVMLGAWNLGELAGAGYLQWKGRESRISNWLIVAAVAALSHWAFYLFPTAWVAVPVSFLIAAAMIGNELGSASYMQSHVAEQELGAVTGFVYGFARAVGMAVLMAAGWAFDALGPASGFFWLAVVFSVITPAYIWAARHFRAEKIDTPTTPPDDL
ncbi:MAG TPA: hypothetical protein DD417_04515 [Elusimicrobia bacterium]|nr:hypothetical protein [Elusimicrobiota bacterium]